MVERSSQLNCKAQAVIMGVLRLLHFIPNKYSLFLGAPVRSASTPVFVTIRDNQPPRFTSPTYNASLAEGVSVNEVVRTVTAIDDDEGDVITYSIKVSQRCVALIVSVGLS